MSIINGGGHGRHNGKLTIRDLGRMIQTDYTLNDRKTHERVRQSFDLHLIPFYGDIPAEDMGFLSSAYGALRIGQGAARATVRMEIMHLSKALSIAAADGLIRHRPKLTAPSVSNTRAFLIPAAHLDHIQSRLPEYARDLVEGLYLMGWRTRELLGLRWENVDEINGVIRLEPAPGKVGQGRVFPFEEFPRLRRLISKRKRKTLADEARFGIRIPLVFHRDGAPFRGFRRSWTAACGERPYWLHDLRRSAVSNMVNAGIPIHVVMELVGHKTRSMVDRYHIVTIEDKRQGVLSYSRHVESLQAKIGL